MPDEPARRDEPMTPETAMRTMATVTSHTRGLRVRTEGLTIVIFALCILASYLTIVGPILMGITGDGPGPRPDRFNGSFDRSNDAFNATGPGPRGPPPTAFFLSRYAPLVWYVIAVVVTAAIWRSASLSFHTGLSTPRLVGVFVGWLAIFAAVVFVLAYVQGGSPRSWHLVAWAVVIGLFAALNPLRFTKHGRLAAATMGVSALVMGAYAAYAGLGGRDIGFLSGVALGLPGLVAGLWLMFRG